MKVFSPLVLNSRKIVPITQEPSQTQQNTETVPLQSPTNNTPSSKSLKMKKILSIATFAAARTKSRLNVLVSPSDDPKTDTESANTRKIQHFWKQNAAKLEEKFDINSLSALEGSEKSQKALDSQRKERNSRKMRTSIDLTESASDPVKRRRKTLMDGEGKSAKLFSPSLFSINKTQKRKMSLEDSPTRKMSFDLDNVRHKTPEKIGSAQSPQENCLLGLVHEDARNNPEQKKAQGDPMRGMLSHNLLLSPNTTDSGLTKEGNLELERIPLRHTHTVDLDNPKTKEEIFHLESEHSDSSYVDSLIEENPYDEFDQSDHENNRLKKKSLTLRVFHNQKLCERLPRDSDFHDTKYLLFPDDHWKRRWDIISAFALLYVAIIMPVRLAFADDSTAWEVLDWIIDVIFIGDIIVTFFSAYLDSSYHIITNRKRIAWHYIKGWLLVDIVCILPIEYFTPHTDSNVKYNQLLKLARIPRLYRLIRVVKLIKMFKVMKDETQFEQHMDKSEDYLTPIIFRFAFACCTILLLCHISGCIWYLLVSLNTSELSWPNLYGLEESSKVDQYVASFYFVVQTAVTVGFGDMNPVLPEERLIACFFMVICVLIYSIFTGFLASMISDVDKHNEKYSEKLGILESIKKEYKLSLSFTKQLITSIKYQNRQKMDYSNFLNGLPTQLAVDLSYYMFKEIMENIPFFQGRTKSFMSSIGPLLKPMKIMKNEYIFMQGDPADELFFLKTGKVAFVLKEYKNFEFIKINEGYFFGEVDLLFYGEIRQYTARAIKDCEFYVLNKKDFKKIFLVDFRDIGAEMYDNGHERKVRTRRIYKEAVQACKQHENPNKDDFNLKGKNKIRLLMNPRTIDNDIETESSSSEEENAKFDLLAKIQEEDELELDHPDIGLDHDGEPKDPVAPIGDNLHPRRNSAIKNRFKAVRALLGVKKNNLGDVLEARRASVLGDPFEDEHRALEAQKQKLEADKQVNNLKDRMESLEEQLNQVVTLTKQLSRQLTRSASNASSSPNKNLPNNYTFLSPNRINLDSERLRVREGSNSILPQTPVSNKNESGVFSRLMNQSPRDFALQKSDGEDATPGGSENL